MRRTEWSRSEVRGPSCTHQVRPVVPMHHLGPGAHGQEAGREHFQVGGPGHARGHGRWARRGGKVGNVRRVPANDSTIRGKRPRGGQGVESEHLGATRPRRRECSVRRRARRVVGPCQAQDQHRWFLRTGGPGPPLSKGISYGASGSPRASGLPRAPSNPRRNCRPHSPPTLGARPEGDSTSGPRKCPQPLERAASRWNRKCRGWGLRRTGKRGHRRRRRRHVTQAEMGLWAGASVFFFYLISNLNQFPDLSRPHAPVSLFPLPR